MNINKSIRWVLSRLIQGAGMGISTCFFIGGICAFFMMDGGMRYLIAVGCVVGAVAGYYLYKFAVVKIFDDRPDDW